MQNWSWTPRQRSVKVQSGHARAGCLYWIDIEPGRLHKLRETYNVNLNPASVTNNRKESPLKREFPRQERTT